MVSLLVLVAVLVGACGGAAAPSSGVTSTAALPSSGATASQASQPAEASPSMDLPATSASAAAASQPIDPLSVNPCSVITQAEANAVAGVKTGDPMPAGDPPVRCVWPTPPDGAVGQVELGIGDGAKKAYDIDHDILKHTFTPIPGLGDEGYSESGAVFFRLGDVWVALNVVRLDDESRWMPKLIALAKTVAGRLGG